MQLWVILPVVVDRAAIGIEPPGAHLPTLAAVHDGVRSIAKVLVEVLPGRNGPGPGAGARRGGAKPEGMRRPHPRNSRPHTPAPRRSPAATNVHSSSDTSVGQTTGRLIPPIYRL